MKGQRQNLDNKSEEIGIRAKEIKEIHYNEEFDPGSITMKSLILAQDER